MAWLRDENPSEMVEPLWDAGQEAQGYAIFEMIAHGNFRKAATLAREMIKIHPECKNSITEDCGTEMADILLTRDLLTLPSKPSEVKK